MKLEKSFTIDGQVVEHIGGQGNLDYYTRNDGDGKILYIARDKAIIGKLSIEADMGQGVGFVSEIQPIDFF